MDLGMGNTLLPGDPRLIDHIVGEVKSQGIFDQFRKDALADVDTKPAYQNLRTRVEASVNSFLNKQTWKADLNKNQLRETLRKQISDATYLDAGVERIVDQVVNPKIYSVFMPEIEDVVYKYLGLEKPKREKNGACGIKDLLPIDLDPVSPESDKNSLKDVSLDSVDAGLVLPDEKCKESEEKVDDIVDNNLENSDVNDENINNGHDEVVEKLDEVDKIIQECSTPPQPVQQLEQSSLNESAKSDDKTEEEEEEDSPVFEPIDIMNLNESNISNDSHLSGISELTSHRSRSPDFANEFARDNFDFSNQDSQLSKVSSDSRLSIVTDFGSSNQASTPISDVPKEDNREKMIPKDNFKAIREEGEKNKEPKPAMDSNKVKENSSTELNNSNIKSSKVNTSKESSRDGIESAIKDKVEQKEKEKIRESSKSKSSKERSDSRDSRSHRDRDKDHKKKSSSSDSKNDNSVRSKTRDKSESGGDTTEKMKESKDSITSKSKDEKIRESTGSKEPKDLKDIYKEKIRELREKKELTEKERLNKENKESSKTSKDSSHKRESSRDKKDHRSSSSSSKSHSSKYESSKSKSSSRDDKSSSRSSSKDTSRRDDRRRDAKENKSRSQSESAEKSESRRSSKAEKDDKLDNKSSQKSSSSRKESRSASYSRSSEKSDNKRENDSKDKKRRDEKKSKLKDDHPSMRKNSNDRRSSDRDGSNGSNGKGSTEKSNSSPSMSSTTPAASSLNKESSNASSNSSSETSDGVEEQLTECPNSNQDTAENPPVFESTDKNHDDNTPTNTNEIDCGQNEISLPLKKRPLNSEEDATIAPSPSSSSNNDNLIKKPKFARNFEEAKKMMKIRKKLEKQKFLAQYDLEKKTQSQDESDEASSSSTKKNDVEMVPDNERVQIIEVRVDSDDEPYPDDKPKIDMTTEQQTKIILDGEQSLESEILATKSKLSEMELSIRESLNEMMSDHNLREASKSNRNIEKSQRRTSKMSNTGKSKKLADIATTSKSEKNSRTSRDVTSRNVEKHFDLSDSDEDCLYFIEDNERLVRFTKFLDSLGLDDYTIEDDNTMLSHELGSLGMRSMAPPQSKRKYSTSPLSDIILNNSDNNNEGHKITSSTATTTSAAIAATIYDDESEPKRKKLGRPKRQRSSSNLSSSQNVTNGDHFVMPLSPDSDVSASSEKMPLQSTKDDKSRPRNNQRYTSDDLYKPRPLFVSSSRRNRRSNQS